MTEVAGLAPEVPDIIETDEVTLQAANEIADTDAEEEEDEEEEAEEAPAGEGAAAKARRADDEPVSFSACISAIWRSWRSSDPNRSSKPPANRGHRDRYVENRHRLRARHRLEPMRWSVGKSAPGSESPSGLC